MADLARSAITFNLDWKEQHSQPLFNRDVTITLTGQGGTTNRILASVFGLLKFTKGGTFVKNDNSAIYVGVPSIDGSMLLLSPGAAPMVPADVTATIRGVVVGTTI